MEAHGFSELRAGGGWLGQAHPGEDVDRVLNNRRAEDGQEESQSLLLNRKTEWRLQEAEQGALQSYFQKLLLRGNCICLGSHRELG